MPSPIQNSWTLKKLLTNTYMNKRNRYDYKLRDTVKGISIEKISVYNGLEPGEARTKFVIKTRSTPQYWPYFTKKDSKGRLRKRQNASVHTYQVIIQLEELSLSVPFKGRVGAEGKWDSSPAGQAHKSAGRVVEGKNYLRGINADFIFTCEYLWKKEGILFGKPYAVTPPIKTNPSGIIFAPKHFIATVELLMRAGYLKK